MPSKMRKTLKILYPDEFGKRSAKRKKPGFIRRRLNSLRLYFSEMKTPKLIMGVCVFVCVISGGYTVYAYNHFTAYSQAIKTARGNIEKEIQRRNDLINNLVPPTLNYLRYEKDLFSHVVEIRKELTDMNRVLEKTADNSETDNKKITREINTQFPALLGIFENYPDLKASKPFEDLMKELIETENRIAHARESFNESVKTYNTYITRLPANAVAYAMGYKLKTWFKASDSASVVPDMKRLGE